MIDATKNEVKNHMNEIPKPVAARTLGNDQQSVQSQIRSFGAVFVFAKAKLSQTLLSVTKIEPLINHKLNKVLTASINTFHIKLGSLLTTSPLFYATTNTTNPFTKESTYAPKG